VSSGGKKILAEPVTLKSVLRNGYQQVRISDTRCSELPEIVTNEPCVAIARAMVRKASSLSETLDSDSNDEDFKRDCVVTHKDLTNMMR
jgi:hypothetical protein